MALGPTKPSRRVNCEGGLVRGDLFTTLTVQLHQSASTADIAQRLASAALRTTTCEQAAVMLSQPQEGLVVSFSTGRLAEEAAVLELRLRTGPSLEAAAHGVECVVADTRRDTRWPRWASGVNEQAAVRSCLAVPLSIETDTFGTVLLVSTTPYAFRTVDAMLGSVLARHAAAAIGCMRGAGGPGQATESHSVIGQAQSVVSVMRKH